MADMCHKQTCGRHEAINELRPRVVREKKCKADASY